MASSAANTVKAGFWIAAGFWIFFIVMFIVLVLVIRAFK